MNSLIYLSLALSAVTLAISIYLAIKIKAVHYLLEQPVVKKMSPQLKLKPVKLDEMVAERGRQQQNRDGRPQGGNDRRGDRDRRDGSREGRPEGDRSRGENRDRRDGDRNRGGDRDRRDGDRNRGGDRDRRDGNRNDQNRPPRETFENREPVAAPSETAQPARFESDPSQDAPLSPRRPFLYEIKCIHNHVHTG